MFYGVILADSRSGALLFSKAWEAGFGVQPATSTAGDTLKVAMSLSSLLSVLSTNAADLPIEGKGKDGEPPRPLQMIDTGKASLFCASDPKWPDLLCAVFASRLVPARVGQALCDRTLECFGSRFASRLSEARRSLKVFAPFAEDLNGILSTDLPRTLAQWTVDCLEASCRPAWAFLVFSSGLCADMDGAETREATPRVRPGRHEQEQAHSPPKRSRAKSRSKEEGTLLAARAPHRYFVFRAGEPVVPGRLSDLTLPDSALPALSALAYAAGHVLSAPPIHDTLTAAEFTLSACRKGEGEGGDKERLHVYTLRIGMALLILPMPTQNAVAVLSQRSPPLHPGYSDAAQADADTAFVGIIPPSQPALAHPRRKDAASSASASASTARNTHVLPPATTFYTLAEVRAAIDTPLRVIEQLSRFLEQNLPSSA